MILEARADSCFSTTHVLKLDGRAIGKFEGRWFGESLDIALIGRRKLIFHKLNWLSSEFVLKSEEPETYLGHADRAGLFSSAWKIDLSIGACDLVRAGWFDTAYHVQQGGRVEGRVDRLGWCERGWQVSGERLSEEDMILVGMVYHTVLRRQQQSAAAHGGAGS